MLDNFALYRLIKRPVSSARLHDWAAKATRLLGIRAVIAGSFERIHRRAVGKPLTVLIHITSNRRHASQSQQSLRTLHRLVAGEQALQ
jgi:aconitase A